MQKTNKFIYDDKERDVLVIQETDGDIFGYDLNLWPEEMKKQKEKEFKRLKRRNRYNKIMLFIGDIVAIVAGILSILFLISVYYSKLPLTLELLSKQNLCNSFVIISIIFSFIIDYRKDKAEERYQSAINDFNAKWNLIEESEKSKTKEEKKI